MASNVVAAKIVGKGIVARHRAKAGSVAAVRIAVATSCTGDQPPRSDGGPRDSSCHALSLWVTNPQTFSNNLETTPSYSEIRIQRSEKPVTLERGMEHVFHVHGAHHRAISPIAVEGLGPAA